MSPSPDPRDSQTLEQAFNAYCEAWVDGESPDPESFYSKYPQHKEQLKERIEELMFVSKGLKSSRQASPSKTPDKSGAAPGSVLDDFKIIREIGRGGMGVVYLAQQISLNRTVALKVLPAHLTLREASIARFKREASTAAKLTHPNIVEIYQVGEHQGNHYFAMELVTGAPMDKVIQSIQTKKADSVSSNKLILAVRANLIDSLNDSKIEDSSTTNVWRKTYIETVCRFVMQVANALHCAHEAGVIHRDVKPSNIIIRETGRVALTDFGLAKDEGLPSMSVTGEFAGSPYYVSPEQAMPKRHKVDLRTDIYSLGVTLYELLCLKKPFEGKTSHEVLGKIISKEPALPRSINGSIPKDLETICLTAMEKDPARRYQSAEEFKLDMERFLEFRPVKARPLGMVTRAFRTVRRNPVYASLIFLLFLFVVIGPVVFGFQQKLANIKIKKALADKEEALRDKNDALGEKSVALIEKDAALIKADKKAEEAKAETETTRQVLSFIESLFKISDPSEIQGKSITVFDLVVKGEEYARRKFDSNPDVQARLLSFIGSMYVSLGLYAEAQPLHEESLDLFTKRRGLLDPKTLDARYKLGNLYVLKGDFPAAELYLCCTLDGMLKTLGESHRNTLAVMQSIAGLYRQMNRPKEAEALYLKTLDLRKKELGEDDPDTLESMNELAFMHMAQGHFKKAEGLFLKSLNGRRAKLGDFDPATLTSICDLAVLFFKQKRFQEAETLYLEALEKRRAVLGEEHPDTIKSKYKLGLYYLELGMLEKARSNLWNAMELRSKVLGDEHPKTLIARTQCAVLLHREGRFKEAAPLFEETLTLLENKLGIKHNFTLCTQECLARFYLDRNQKDKALGLAEAVVKNTPEEHLEYDNRMDLLKAIRDL